MEVLENYSEWKIVGSTIFALAILVLIQLYLSIIAKSQKVRRKLQIQGIRGPPPSFLFGNSSEMQQIQSSKINSGKLKSTQGEIVAHDYASSIFPYFEHWQKQYGPIYMYSTGFRQHLFVNEPGLIKEMNQCVNLALGRPTYVSKKLGPLLGNGVIRSNGHIWTHQRKIIAPEFYNDKVKNMVGLMVKSTQLLLAKWKQTIESNGGNEVEISVDEDLKSLAGDIIAKECFGSSYAKGKKIFSKVKNLQELISNQNSLFGINNFRCTKNSKLIANLEREIESLIWETVKEREKEQLGNGFTDEKSKDLMQCLLEAVVDQQNDEMGISAKKFLVDNCKNIYFAGHEITLVTAEWCLMLLALHPEWQSRIREEVARVCANGFNAISVLNLNVVTMVIQEALRLFPPGAFISREALEEVEIGNIKVPKGVCIWTLIPTLHRDPNVWGQDSNQFNPQRFSQGISKACRFPQAYIPFGIGNRLCLGKNFAMVQLKIILSLIVSSFSFSLSPNYQHSPSFKMIIKPEFGVQILIRKI